MKAQTSYFHNIKCVSYFPPALPHRVHHNLLPIFYNTLLPSFPTSTLTPIQIILCTYQQRHFCNTGRLITLLHKPLNGFPLPSEQTQKHGLQALCALPPDYLSNIISYYPSPSSLDNTYPGLFLLRHTKLSPVLQSSCQLFTPKVPFLHLVLLWRLRTV